MNYDWYSYDSYVLNDWALTTVIKFDTLKVE